MASPRVGLLGHLGRAPAAALSALASIAALSVLPHPARSAPTDSSLAGGSSLGVTVDRYDSTSVGPLTFIQLRFLRGPKTLDWTLRVIKEEGRTRRTLHEFHAADMVPADSDCVMPCAELKKFSPDIECWGKCTMGPPAFLALDSTRGRHLSRGAVPALLAQLGESEALDYDSRGPVPLLSGT